MANPLATLGANAHSASSSSSSKGLQAPGLTPAGPGPDTSLTPRPLGERDVGAQMSGLPKRTPSSGRTTPTSRRASLDIPRHSTETSPVSSDDEASSQTSTRGSDRRLHEDNLTEAQIPPRDQFLDRLNNRAALTVPEVKALEALDRAHHFLLDGEREQIERLRRDPAIPVDCVSGTGLLSLPTELLALIADRVLEAGRGSALVKPGNEDIHALTSASKLLRLRLADQVGRSSLDRGEWEIRDVRDLAGFHRCMKHIGRLPTQPLPNADDAYPMTDVLEPDAFLHRAITRHPSLRSEALALLVGTVTALEDETARTEALTALWAAAMDEPLRGQLGSILQAMVKVVDALTGKSVVQAQRLLQRCFDTLALLPLKERAQLLPHLHEATKCFSSDVRARYGADIRQCAREAFDQLRGECATVTSAARDSLWGMVNLIGLLTPAQRWPAARDCMRVTSELETSKAVFIAALAQFGVGVLDKGRQADLARFCLSEDPRLETDGDRLAFAQIMLQLYTRYAKQLTVEDLQSALDCFARPDSAELTFGPFVLSQSLSAIQPPETLRSALGQLRDMLALRSGRSIAEALPTLFAQSCRLSVEDGLLDEIEADLQLLHAVDVSVTGKGLGPRATAEQQSAHMLIRMMLGTTREVLRRQDLPDAQWERWTGELDAHAERLLGQDALPAGERALGIDP